MASRDKRGSRIARGSPLNPRAGKKTLSDGTRMVVPAKKTKSKKNK